MAHLSKSALGSVSALLAALGAAVAVACGGGGAKTPAKAGRGDAGASGAATELAATPPPSGLPPMAAMPAPGVAGSKRAKTKADNALATCAGAAKPQAK